MHVTAIIVAAGKGKRMGGQAPKQFLQVAGHPVLWWTTRAFQECKDVDAIVLVSEPDNEIVRSIREEFPKVCGVAVGGAERQDSVRSGLGMLPECTDIVLVHDGARCLVSADMIRRVVSAARERGAAIAAVPVEDTVKMVDAGGRVVDTLDRSSLYRVQTPQGFLRNILLEAFRKAAPGHLYTDDSSMVEDLGHSVQIVYGSPENIKITTPIDLVIAREVLVKRGVM